ncbi:MAG: hypothetical protein PHI68_06275 [Candidatus Cloacimonetes bacterium]|nr:hypothetical protein [Candidatus Cloacimonadota bacterium]
MKIIFSRKGFDSSYGGSPSPILEDDTIVSLPIPASDCSREYSIRYRDLRPQGVDLGKLINDLAVKTSNGKVSSKDLAHFDPDICDNAYSPREPGWRGLFGQCLAAQGHLRNQGVGIGDLLLFYGLYQRVKKVNGNYVYDKSSRPIHLIWGWMQIGDIVDVAKEQASKQIKYPWASYHPHYHFQKQPANNTLYVANESLSIEGLGVNKIKGYGVFEHYREELQLTDPDYDKTSYWRLPEWMYQENKLSCPLTYNANRGWKLENGYARLKSYTRGQEFVYSSRTSKDLIDWLSELLR